MSAGLEDRVAGRLARLHRRSRRWPVPGQVAWWVLLVPVAVVAWAGTLRPPWLRRSVWLVTVLATLAAGVSNDERSSRPTVAGTETPSSSTTSNESRSASTLARAAVGSDSTIQPSSAPPSVATSPASAAPPPSTSMAQAPTASTIPGSLLATVVLDGVKVERERPDGYSREQFPTWLTVTSGGCDARTFVLMRESTRPLGEGGSGCSLAGGAWVSPYEGEAITDPGNAQIDHVVSVKEAWDSGAWAWTAERRAAFANDVTDARTLRAVTPSANSSKGDKDPSNWVPPRAGYVCTYVSHWLSIKSRWGLTMDESEAGRIRNLLQGPCAGTVVEPWSPAPARLASMPTTTAAPDTIVEAPTSAPIQGVLTPPPTSAPAQAPPAPTDAPAPSDVKPGAFCSVDGATGVYEGRPYVCDRYSQTGSSYQGDRPHWRPV